MIMEQEYKIAALIQRYVSGNATEEERNEVERWMAESEEHGACEGKKKLATRAKELGLDAIHDTVHEMCKDEARHGCAFQGLLNRYFGK